MKITPDNADDFESIFFNANELADKLENTEGATGNIDAKLIKSLRAYCAEASTKLDEIDH